MGSVEPQINSNDILIRINDLPRILGLQSSSGKAVQTLVGVMSMPLTQLGYDPDGLFYNSDSLPDSSNKDIELLKSNPQIERLTEYSFDSGQKLRVKQNTNGVTLSDSRYEMSVNFEGEIPDVAFVSF